MSAQHWICCCDTGGEPTECCRCEGDAEYPSSVSFSWTGQITIEQMNCADLDCTPIQQYHIGVKDPESLSISGSITIPFDASGCGYLWCELFTVDVERWYFSFFGSPPDCAYWTLDTTAYTYETAKVVRILPPNLCASRDYWLVEIYLATIKLVFHSEGGYHCLPKMLSFVSADYGFCGATARNEYISLASSTFAIPPLCSPTGIDPYPPLGLGMPGLLNKLKSATIGTVTIT